MSLPICSTSTTSTTSTTNYIICILCNRNINITETDHKCEMRSELSENVKFILN